MSDEVVTTTEAAGQVETVTPTEQVQQPENAQTSGTEQTSADDKPKDSAPKGEWVQRRIDQLTREKHEERRQREVLEERLRQFEPQSDDRSAAAPAQHQDVEKAAAQLVKQRDFDSACNKVFEDGKKEFPDFGESLKTFQMLGGAPAEFLEAITSMDHGAKVIQHLGKDPEAAERILSMPPLKMALALARLETTLAQAKPVSKAPSPITPVGKRSAPVEPEEFKTTSDYIEWRKKNR